MRFAALCCAVVLAVVLLPAVPAQAGDFSFDRSQSFLNTYCASCHSGKSPAGGFNISQISVPASLADQADRWNRVSNRVRSGEMPPRGLPGPPLDDREAFLHWVSDSLHTAA